MKIWKALLALVIILSFSISAQPVSAAVIKRGNIEIIIKKIHPKPHKRRHHHHRHHKKSHVVATIKVTKTN